jgi:hypothetical protein
MADETKALHWRGVVVEREAGCGRLMWAVCLQSCHGSSCVMTRL